MSPELAPGPGDPALYTDLYELSMLQSYRERGTRSRATFELYARDLVLVRPDGHVAWRGDAGPDDALAVVDRVRGGESSA